MKQIIAVCLIVVAFAATPAHAYSGTFNVQSVDATERAYTWIVRDDNGAALQLFDADGLSAQRSSRNGRPALGMGMLQTEREHGISEVVFFDRYGGRYGVL